MRLKVYLSLVVTIIITVSLLSMSFHLYANSEAIVADKKKPTLIVGYGAHNAPPYAIVENNQLVGGIIKDISDEITKLLEIDVSYVETPRKRLADFVASGEIHFTPISNPEWVENSSNFLWSDVLFSEQDRLWTERGRQSDIAKIEDLFGMTIGTINSYVYPTLDTYFEQEKIIRSDTRTLHSNIVRLKLGRIDGFIGSNNLVPYHISQNDDHSIKLNSFVISEHQLYGILSLKAPITLEQLNHAIELLHQRGAIRQIISAYAIGNELE